MKNLFINCILASLALLAVLSCRQEDEVVVEPRLDMVTDSVIAEPDGGHYVIEYVLSNPVEGVSVVASSAQNWITDFVYEDGRIGFDVGGNTEVSSREGLVRVTYGDYMGFDVPVCQAAAGYAGYEMAADYFFGTYYGDMYGESYNFYVILSDTDVHDDGSFADGGNYYVFDMYCSEPEEGKLVPAEGTYVLGEAGSTASMTFSSEMSCAYLPYREEDYGTELYFSEGELVVKVDGDVLSLEAVLTDTDGDTHRVTWSGIPVVDDYSGGDVPSIDHDIDLDARYASGLYLTTFGSTMYLNLALTDMETDENGEAVPPGTLVFLDLYMPVSNDGNIVNGEYNVSDDYADFTLYPGISSGGMLMGTYAQSIGADGSSAIGLVSEGSVQISGSAGDYSIVCDFVTKDGYSIKCRYTGELVVLGMP